MSPDPNTPPAPTLLAARVVPLKRAPTLYVIIAMKLFKGIFFASLALTAYVLSDNNLPAEYQTLLHQLKHWTNLNPEKRFWVEIAAKVDALTEAGMLRVALGTLIYSLFALVEGVGLMFRVTWAGWLSIGESAFFIPIEIFDLLHNFNWVVFFIMVINIFMVWYLFQNRDRLFKHH
jgi:uncharacterized membrane protein (DUF2068 family)